MNIRTISKLHYLPHIDSFGAKLWLTCLSSALLCPAFAHARMEIRVQGKATLEGELQRSSESQEYRVVGTLTDELRTPIGRKPLVFATIERGSRRVTQVDAKACEDDGARTSQARALGVTTEQDGSYCAVVDTGRMRLGDEFLLQVEYRGDTDYVGATTSLDAADFRASLHPRLDAPPYRVSLDDEVTPLSLLIEGEHSPSPKRKPLEFSLAIREQPTGSQERSLGSFSSAGSSAIPFNVSSNAWRAPGPAILVIRFSGDANTRPFELFHPVLRTVRVKATVTQPPESAVAGDRISFTCLANTRLGSASIGSIELSSNGTPTQVVPLTRTGAAPFELAVPKSLGTMRLSVRYLPALDGYVAAPSEEWSVNVTAPSPWRHSGWAIAGGLVLVWFAMSRRRVPQVTREPRTTAATLLPRAHVELLGPPSRRNVGWDGLVVDAHEGTPLCDAQIAVYQAGFGTIHLLYETLSDTQGTFSIPTDLLGGASGCELAVRSHGYAAFRTALPLPGHLKIHLVSVRRALLDRLVDWAKRRGAPFRTKAEPTPDWIAEVAHSRGHADVERWANAVSAAAFGPLVPPEVQAPELQPPAGPATPLSSNGSSES
ncbi:MAG: hypothetical protein QM784_01600 [Polyangiaceae bacterium]